MISLSDTLGNRPLFVVMRAPTAERFVDVATTLHGAGVPALEFTLSSSGALEALERARTVLPTDALLGAGTVRTLDQVNDAIDAGAQFLVSQVQDPALVSAAHDRGVPFIPGALTPNEIVRAWALGVQAVKVSPAGPVGGVRYISELVGPLPEIPLMPTGGVLCDQVADYLRAGSRFVGVSRDLLGTVLDGDVLDADDLAALGARAARVVAAVDAR